MRCCLYAVLLFLASLAFAHPAPAASACQLTAEVERALHPFNGDLYFSDMDEHLATINRLLLRYPDDIPLNLEHIQLTTVLRGAAGRKEVLQEAEQRYRAHPESAVARFVYAYALWNVDTPKARELAEESLRRDPDFGWPHYLLAEIARPGRFADPNKIGPELDAFLTSCPQLLDESVWVQLGIFGPSEVVARHAQVLRRDLEADTNPLHLPLWKALWDLEFKAVPPAEHERVRKQIAVDLARLDNGGTELDRLWVLKQGYLLLGDEAGQERINEQLVKLYPKSLPAKRVWDQRWWKAHPDVTAGDSEERKQRTWDVQAAFYSDQLKTWPKDDLLTMEYFEVLRKRKATTSAELSAAADLLRQRLRHSPFCAHSRIDIAREFVARRLRLNEVPAVVDAYSVYFEAQTPGDVADDQIRQQFAEFLGKVRVDATEVLTDLAWLRRDPAIAAMAVRKMGDEPPAKKEDLSLYWQTRARYAELSGHKLDALTFYRASLETQLAAAQPDLRPELEASINRLWRELGGGVQAKFVFDRPAAVPVTESGWKHPEKVMTPWEMTDVDGKSWTLASLRGKVVYINLWSTTCLPCQQELALVQQLYQEMKLRDDVQVVTFNLDFETGRVAPFLKEHGYTFPVLLAKNYVDGLLGEYAVPQNWILDVAGNWRWQGEGYNNEDWPEGMRRRIDAAKIPPCEAH